MEYKKITVVDENDRVIGYENYHDAVAKGSIRRASCVFLRDEEGNHLITKRSKYISKPQLFDQSSGGHVDEGETYLQTAHRELKEELGLHAVSLTEVCSSFKAVGFFTSVYKATISHNTQITFDEHEVESIHWMTKDEVDILVSSTPELCNPNFVEMWQQLRAALIT